MDESSAFLLGNQSAAVAMSALHAAAATGMMDKGGSAPTTAIPFYPYNIPTSSFHTNNSNMQQPASSPSPSNHGGSSSSSSSNASGTPFGINDILNRGAGVSMREHFGSGSGGGTDDCAALKYGGTVAPSPLGGRGCTTTAAAVAAQAAAMLFNNGAGHVMHSTSSGVRLGKPLTDLPGRPPIYWPGVLADDWHDKLNMHSGYSPPASHKSCRGAAKRSNLIT